MALPIQIPTIPGQSLNSQPPPAQYNTIQYFNKLSPKGLFRAYELSKYNTIFSRTENCQISRYPREGGGGRGVVEAHSAVKATVKLTWSVRRYRDLKYASTRFRSRHINALRGGALFFWGQWGGRDEKFPL